MISDWSNFGLVECVNLHSAHAGEEFHHIRAEIVCVKPRTKKKLGNCVYMKNLNIARLVRLRFEPSFSLAPPSPPSPPLPPLFLPLWTSLQRQHNTEYNT